MDSTRQQKIGRMMQKEISALFTLEGKNYYGNSFVTVTNVRVTPDLGIAYVQLSLFKEKEAKKIIDHMNKASHDIRRKLGARIKNQIRHIPDLKFFHDSSLDYVDHMEEIFKEIHKDDKKENE